MVKDNIIHACILDLLGARGPDKKLAAVLTREVVECVCKLMAIVALPLGRSP